MRTIIGMTRLGLYGLLCAALIPLQALVLLFTRGAGAYVIPPFYHKLVCALFGITIEVAGKPAAARHILFLSNHISYLDIEVISAVLKTSFVAKEDVAHWPLFGLLAKLQQTVFITRDPRRAETGRAAFARGLQRPMPLVLFAEGTSSNGESVLPFKSSLFDLFFDPDIKAQLTLQPLTIDLLAVDGQPVQSAAQRERYAYHGETVLAPHLWAFAKGRGARVRLVFHDPLDINAYPDRKALAAAAQTACAAGLSFAKDEAPLKPKGIKP